MNVSVTKTITSIFMVPTLKINRENLMSNGFINGYAKDGRKDVQYENCIYLLFKPDDVDKFRDFLDGEYERTKSIVDDYDYEDGYVVVVYELSPKFKKDFELVRQSRYSKTSEEFQKLFPKIIKIKKNGVNREEVSLQFRVFNKTEDLKQFWEDKLGVEFDDEVELWHGFFEENEVLNLDKIKENV
jgi:hypothetical protein